MQNFSQQPQFPEQEQLKCPRCDSTNTKFCYYNNYNLSQPRHYCKGCKRYWTKGGALRNIPVGGGSRKNAKRSSSSAGGSTASAAAKRPASVSASEEKNDSDKNNSSGENNFEGQFGNFMEMNGSLSFSSLLGGSSSSGAQFGGFLDGLGPSGPSLETSEGFGDPGSGRNVDPQAGNADEFLNIGGGGGGGGGGWPDLAI
ncbi:hypothetical protein DH2020_038230 [Rehmannia glutinosa]|uniref:Dof zinc finger protein n=1 Tax=Rehmannia glutinosa TaxID=99300 RepID=A0ABR0UZE0_REHGL